MGERSDSMNRDDVRGRSGDDEVVGRARAGTERDVPEDTARRGMPVQTAEVNGLYTLLFDRQRDATRLGGRAAAGAVRA